MSKCRINLESLKKNLCYFQLITNTLDNLIKSITSPTLNADTAAYSLKNETNDVDFIVSGNYLEQPYLTLDTSNLLINKLFTTLDDAIKSIYNLELSVSKLESIDLSANNEITILQIIDTAKYVISVLRQDFTLKISLARTLPTIYHDEEELQRVRFLWLDSPVSENSRNNTMFSTRMNTLKMLLKC